jgi:hypothetical protein
MYCFLEHNEILEENDGGKMSSSGKIQLVAKERAAVVVGDITRSADWVSKKWAEEREFKVLHLFIFS